MSVTEKAQELLNELSAAVDGLMTTEAWQAYLDMQSRFHRYSWNNTLLILRQCPTATHVAGFSAWKKLNRQVKTGEHGIRILAPRTIKVTEAGEDGTERSRSRVTGFGVASVFDISQTVGEPLPDVVHPLMGEGPAGLLDQLLGFASSKDCPVAFGETGTAHGMYFPRERRIVIAADRNPAQQTKTLAHEVGHMLLHGPDDDMEKADKELEAESIAYIVCRHFGFDTSGYSLGYIATWQGGNEEANTAFRKSATRIQKGAAEVIDWIEHQPVASPSPAELVAC